MVNISPPIQKLIFRSFQYQPFDVQCVLGKEIPLADALFHVTPLTEGEYDGIHLPIIAIKEVTGENSIAFYSTRGNLTENQERSTTTLTNAIHHQWLTRGLQENFHLNFGPTASTEMNFP